MTHQDFKILFDAHFESVRRFIYYRCGDTDVATDVSQETFMKLWEKQLKPDKGKEIALMFKIASNILVSRVRRNQTAMNYRKSMVMATSPENPAEQLEYEELKQKYEFALQSLTDKQRVVFLLSRVDELSYLEMSQRLDISVKAIEKRMSQALASLRKALL
ncbi:MAG: sigma-70 family RNA polymerase sigma factor [Bacteroidales bacterium]|nr:sigma-70 family RNA polymerase sigma factor [Bacteroidales bacterium]